MLLRNITSKGRDFVICDFYDIKEADVMVIDDEKLNLEIIDELLKDVGFSNINCFNNQLIVFKK
jgi:hypothetical protein